MRSLFTLGAAAALLALVAPVSAATPAFRLLGQINVTEPAFMTIGDLTGKGTTDLLVSQFTGSPFSSGSLSMIPSVDQGVANGFATSTPSVVESSFNWPNQANIAPAGIFSGAPVNVIIADGFLVPGKSNGGIYLVPVTNGVGGTVVTLSQPKSGYFYHQTKFIDINGDGRLDILTARAEKGLFGSGSGELLWLEQPATNTASAWTEHVIVAGPDVNFAVAELDGDATTLEILATQFFTNSFSLYQVKLGTGAFIQSAVIDANIGPAYSLVVDDFNMDGKTDVLVDDHTDASTNGVWIYELPANGDLFTTTWPKHQIASGFPVTEGGFNQAAPGYLYSVRPSTSDKTSKPTILLAGDGSQSAYVLSWNSDWKYDQTTIVDNGGTLGSMAIGDVNADGWLEFFVPNYDAGYIQVYTFAPAAKHEQRKPKRISMF